MTGQQINERLLNYSSAVLITFFLPLISLLRSLYVYYLFLLVHHLFVIFLLG